MLNDLVVIDAASYVAGPAAATVMADYGADVVKVEPLSGDGYRGLAARHRTDYNWQLTSRNKRDIALDLSRAEGQEVLLKLLDKADVLIVNFNSEQLTRFNLSFEQLHERNPRLILAQLTGYGNRGPEAGRRAFDVAAWWARSGIVELMKPVQGLPPNGVGGVGDHASAMSLFGGIMMALYRRETTGEGSYVSSTLAGNGAWSNGMQLQGAIAGFDLSAILDGKGYRSPFVVSYETRDGRFIILVGANPGREWPRLCDALGHPEWVTDERFPDMAGIMKNRDDLRAMFATCFKKMTLLQAVRSLDEHDITYSVVERLQDVIQDAQLIENEIVIPTASDHPDYQWTINSPIEVSGLEKEKPRMAPEIGEHSNEILREAGYSEAEIEQLADANVIRQA